MNLHRLLFYTEKFKGQRKSKNFFMKTIDKQNHSDIIQTKVKESQSQITTNFDIGLSIKYKGVICYENYKGYRRIY